MSACTRKKNSIPRGLAWMSLLGLSLAVPGTSLAAAPEAQKLLELTAHGDGVALETALPRLPHDWALLANARMAAGRLDETRSVTLAERFLALRGATHCDAAFAQAIIADAAFASARYARAATAAHAHRALLENCRVDAGMIADAAMIEVLAGHLAHVAPQREVSFRPASASFTRDKAGLARTRVEVNGVEQEAVLDLGANLSMVSASRADQLGLRRLGEASVGSSSRAAVSVEVALADRMEIAGLVLEYVPFLVVDDAQLEMPLPGGYKIDAIIGFPVFRAMGRLRFNHDGTLLPEPDKGEAGPPSNLFLAGSDLFVDARVNDIRIPLHLDSGGNSSFLSRSFSNAHSEALQGLKKTRQRLAGAGGSSERDIVLWNQAKIAVDHRAMVIPSLPVVVRDPGQASELGQGVLANDVLDAFDHWTVDLRHMRLELGTLRPRP